MEVESVCRWGLYVGGICMEVGVCMEVGSVCRWDLHGGGVLIEIESECRWALC